MNAPFSISMCGIDLLTDSTHVYDLMEARALQNGESPTREAVLQLISHLRGMSVSLEESRAVELRALRKLEGILNTG